MIMLLMMMMGTIVNAADDDDDDDFGGKSVLRDLVTMRKFRTFSHKESYNVFSSIKFEQQILNSRHFFQVVYAISAIKHFKSFQC